MASTMNLGKRTAVNLFFVIFIQALIALLFDSGGLISGTVASIAMNIKQIKWILLMYGPLLAARGDIAVLVGKLGAGLHFGTIKPTFRNNTPAYKGFITSTFTFAIFAAVLIGAITYIINLITFPIEYKVLNPTLFFVIPIIVLALAALISSQITSAISFFTYKKGLNPDVYGVPLMSTINNILITLLFAGTLFVLKPWTVGDPSADYWLPAKLGSGDMFATYLAIIPAALAFGSIFYIILKNRKDHEYRKIMKESIFAVFASAFIGTITGITLSNSGNVLERFPQLLIAFPALINVLVDQTSIMTNVLITDFSAGYIEPKLSSVKKPKTISSFFGIGLAGIIISLFLGFISTFIKWPFIVYKWHIVIVMLVTCLSNFIGFIIVGLMIYVLTMVAFRKEIDPDNFAVPLTACLADLVCVGLLIALSYGLLLPLPV
ncbi:MAG: magnesium transporter [Candidatus Heimdallarchaeota archaeon]|nr:magnesium transporter [Candidatus Heimdallarchaeota archaeon]